MARTGNNDKAALVSTATTKIAKLRICSWKCFSKRSTIGVFVALFIILECVVLLLHELWLPRVVDMPPHGGTVIAADRRRAYEIQALLPARTIKSSHVYTSNQSAKTTKRLRNIVRTTRQPTDGKIKGEMTTGEPRVSPGTNTKLSALSIAAQTSNNNNKNNKMTHAGNKKRMKMNHWDPGAQGLHQPPMTMRVETPIFVASLPKSGTTSIWQYFNCGARKASHQWVKTWDGHSIQAGVCMLNNIIAGRPAFEGCGDYDVYTDAGYSMFVSKNISDCYYPSMTALPAIHRHYPNATIIQVVRNSTSWLQSMQAWGEGSLLQRWKNCNLTAAAGVYPEKDGEWAFAKFYDWHTEHVREFCRQHDSLKYIEVPLESPRVGKLLEENIGIPASCWGKCTPASKYCDRVAEDVTKG